MREKNIKGRKLASLDVVSLFTNVPIVETIKIILDTIRIKNISVGLSLNDLEKLLLLCVADVQFIVNENYYTQVDGVAMRSPLGPILANIFLGYHENKLLTKIKFPLTYFNNIDNLLNKANNLHPNLKFTVEHESNNKLPFLDVLVDNSGDSVVTSVYRKPTWSGLYLNFHSSSNA